jgi:hypothetical protein
MRDDAPMPKGPKGQKRPADVIGCAVMVAKIATGEIEDRPSKSPAQSAGGKLGGKKRAAALTPARRREIAQAAAQKRWKR